MQSELIVVIGTLGGAAIGALGAFGTTWLTKRIEDRKNLREFAVKAAIESWNLHKTTSKNIYPIDHFIIHSVLMLELATEKNLDPTTLRPRLERINAIVSALVDHAKTVNTPKA